MEAWKNSISIEHGQTYPEFGLGLCANRVVVDLERFGAGADAQNDSRNARVLGESDRAHAQ